MSISNILKDGKLIPSVFPAVNPYGGGLGDVLAVSGNGGNPVGGAPQSISNVGNIGCADILSPFGTIQSFSSDLIQSAGGLGNLAILPVNNLTLKGCQTKGSMLVGDGTSSKELPVGVNGLVLKAASGALNGLGVEWAVDGTSGITGVSAGPNITIDSITNPIVPAISVADPLNATLNLGNQNLTGGFPPLATSMAQNYIIGTQFYDVGGSGVKSAEYAPTIMGLYTPLTNSGEVQIIPTDIQVKGPSNSTPTSTTIAPILTTIEIVNGPTTELQRTTLSPTSITTTYENLTPAPTLTSTALTNITPVGGQNQMNFIDTAGNTCLTANQVSTIDAFSKVIFESNTILGQIAETTTTAQSGQVDTDINVVSMGSGTSTRTDITIGGGCLDTHTSTNGDGTIPVTLTATRQDRTIASAIGTTSLQRLQDATYDIITRVNTEFQGLTPVCYIQGSVEDASVAVTTGGGLSFNNTQGEVSLNHTDVPSGRVNQASIIVNGGSSTLALQTTGASSTTGLMTLTPGYAGTDGTLNFTASGSSANFAITTNRNVAFNSQNIFSTATNFRLLNAAAGGALNPILTLQNTNATGSVAMEVYKDKPTAGTNGDVLFNQSVYGKDSGNVKQEYTRITSTIRDATAGAEDGSLELGCFVNGSYANFIQLNANDAPIGEVNFVRPLDFIGGSDANSTIKTSGTGSVNLNLDASTSAGAGGIVMRTKNTTGSLSISGDQITSATAGGNSGRHLRIFLPNALGVLTPYKIQLLDD